MLTHVRKSRRNFIKTAGLALGSGFLPTLAGHGRSAEEGDSKELFGYPQLKQGIQIGDVHSDRAIVWSRSDRPARMLVEYSFNPDFSDARLVIGPQALTGTDYTARIDLLIVPKVSAQHLRIVLGV